MLVGLVAAALGCTRGPAAPASPPPPAPDAAVAGPAAEAWRCFAWVHGSAFGDLCWSSAAACEAARADAVKAHRDVRECRPQREAVCLGDGGQRCYGTMKACLEARAQLGVDDEATCQVRR